MEPNPAAATAAAAAAAAATFCRFIASLPPIVVLPGPLQLIWRQSFSSLSGELIEGTSYRSGPAIDQTFN